MERKELPEKDFSLIVLVQERDKPKADKLTLGTVRVKDRHLDLDVYESNHDHFNGIDSWSIKETAFQEAMSYRIVTVVLYNHTTKQQFRVSMDIMAAFGKVKPRPGFGGNYRYLEDKYWDKWPKEI